MANDPYAVKGYPNEYNERGDSMNGYSGSKTSGSVLNAALNRAPKGGGGNVFAEMVQYGKRPAGIAPQRQPATIAPSVGSIPAYGTSPQNPFATSTGRSVTYGGPGGTTHTPGANPFATPARLPGEPPPVPPGMTRVFGEPAPQGGAVQGYGTAPNQLSTFEDRRIYRMGPNGIIDTSAATGIPQVGNPQGSGTLADRLQTFADPWFTQMGSGDTPVVQENGARPSGFNPDGPPLTGGPFARPPAVPSTQPVPNPRPPAVPSTQPLPNPFTTPANVGRNITYADPQGGTTHSAGGNNPFAVVPFTGGPRWIDEPGPVDSGRTPGGMSAPPQQQYAPNGLPLGTNGIGRRLTPAEDPTTASGRANASYQWFTKPDGTKEFWQVDANGQPVAQASHGMKGPTGNQTAIPWGTAAPVTPSGTSAGTSTTTGQFSAPNNSTTFDPNVLPSSNVGDWLDPVMNDTMDRLSRQLRHEASLTGATNSGGFIPGMTEALAPVANQFAAQRGELMFKDQQAKADRLLDKYKFDNTQQLQAWIETNKNELERYGIDQNVLLGRYNADQSLKAAGLGASASRYAASQGANSSNFNSLLDYMASTYGTDANYNLGMGNLGLGYFNAGNQYNLGLYGTDVERENNMMNYLSRIYGLGPEFLRLLAGSDPSQLIPGMSPGNTVTIR